MRQGAKRDTSRQQAIRREIAAVAESLRVLQWWSDAIINLDALQDGASTGSPGRRGM
jgi:hypothetical protein